VTVLEGKAAIAIISTSPSARCGIGIYTESLYGVLTEEQRSKIVVLSDRSYCGKLRYEKSWERGSSVLSPLRLFFKILEGDYDIVHLQHEWLVFGILFANLFYALMLFMLKLLGKKVVVTFHTVFDLKRLNKETLRLFNIRYPLGLVKKAISFLTKFYAAASNVIVVHTDQMKIALVKQYRVSPRKVVVISHFVKKLPNMGRDEAKRKLGLQGKKVLLLFGLIRKGKGYEHVVRAFQRVRKKIPNAVLLIVGAVREGEMYWGDKYLEYLRRLVKKLGLGDCVRFFTRYIPDDEVPVFFGAADVVVLPYEKGKSYYSASGILHLAMNFNTPVIAARTLQFLEIRDDENGRAVDPENIDELARAIVELLNDWKKGEKYSKNLKRLAESRSIEKCAQKHWKLYQKLLMKEGKSRSRFIWVFPHFLVLLPALFLIFSLNLVNVGRDGFTHVYKAWVLRHQIEALPFWLWGRWDWSWYLGNPFLRSYSPLFYYILASLSFVVPFWTAARILLSLITPLAYISIYKALRHFVKSRSVSIIFATVYIYSPVHIIPFYMWGSLGQAFSTIIVPLYLVQLHKTSQVSQNKCVIKTAFLLAVIMLLNIAVGFWIVVLTIIWFLLKKDIAKLFKIGTCSAALTASFLYAYLTAGGTMLPVITPLSQGERLEEWLESTYRISILHVELTIVIYLAIAVIYVVFRKYGKKNWKKPYWEKVFEVTAVVVVITLILSVFQIFPFSVVGGDRVLTVSGFVVTFIGACYISKLEKTRIFKILGVLLIVVTIIVGCFYRPYVPVHPETYDMLYDIVRRDSGWFRVLFLPREPWGALTPIYTNHSTLNGWYPQCLPPETFDALGSLMTYDKYAYLERNLTVNTEEVLNFVRYLGVKYIIVDGKDPVFPELASSIVRSLLREAEETGKVTLLENHTHRYLFRVENFTPVYALTYVPQSRDEIPWKTERIDRVTVVQEANLFEVRINVPRDYWVIIPVMYDKSMKITLDDKLAQMEIAYPHIIALRVPRGYHVIKIQIFVTFIDKFITSFTVVTWIVVVVYLSCLRLVEFYMRKKC